MAEAGQVATKEKTITPGPEIASRPEAKKSQPPLCPTLSFEKKSHWAWAKFQYDLRQTGLYYYRARYYDPIMGRFLQTDPKGYYDSMNMYQAFNMNPVNFLDPMGELVYLTGEHPEKDFILFKQAFKKIGHTDIDEKMVMKKDGEGRYYIDLVDGKGALSNNISKKVAQSAGYKKWLNKYTIDLKNLPSLYNLELEELFEWIILDRDHTPIDFETGDHVLIKDRILWFDHNSQVNSMRFGGGVTVEPFETENGNVKIVVNPKSYSANVGRNLPLDVPTIIIHEFGHAFGNMLGYFGQRLATQLDIFGITESDEPLFTELSVMFENLYRLRLNQKYLRGWHSSFNSYMKIEGENGR